MRHTAVAGHLKPEEMEKVLMKALIAISYNKEIIQSLAGFHWAIS